MIGQLIGNYRVTRRLGQGGMGQVFEAVHEHIKRRAAIKVLHPEFSRDSEVIRRFFNEALAVNVVQHPSLVGVFESGVLPDGAAFIVMEFLEGETLGSYLKKNGALPEKEALQIGRQVAAALKATHAQDIVHRDLKPDNIMLVPDPEVPGGKRVKILDFGLAKMAIKHQVNAVQTKDGVIMGTPAFMPPEQWMSATMVDAKSDVYALGVILFEMIAGRCPFVGDNVNQLMQKHLYEDAPLLRDVVPQTTEGTNTLISQMLAKPRNTRPTMPEVSEKLEQLIAGIKEGTGANANRLRGEAIASHPTIPGAQGKLGEQQTLPRGSEGLDKSSGKWTDMKIRPGSEAEPARATPRKHLPLLLALAAVVVAVLIAVLVRR